MTGTAAMTYVLQIVNDNQVVFGLYPDANEPNGVGVHLIKGSSELQAVITADYPGDFRVDAVPCADLEQAVAAEQMSAMAPANITSARAVD